MSSEREDSCDPCTVIFGERKLSDLKFPLVYFVTDGVTSTRILPLFWRCVAILELNCKLHVITTVCDGATPIQNLFQLHKGFDCCTDNEVVYRTINIFT